MNLLNFIEEQDINEIDCIEKMPQSFKMINLHTRNIEKAKKQCEEFFTGRLYVGKHYFYFSEASEYQWYGGWQYELKKSNNDIYWLIIKDQDKIEI